MDSKRRPRRELLFSEPVSGLDVGDLQLTLDGGPSLLTGTETLSTEDNRTWTLGSLADLTGARGTYMLTLTAAEPAIVDNAGSSMAAPASDSWVMDSQQRIIQGEASSNTIAIRAGADPGEADVVVNSAPPCSFTLSDTSQFFVIGGNGDDELTLGFSSGSPLPAPARLCCGSRDTAIELP
jgi:hypothetical protein